MNRRMPDVMKCPNVVENDLQTENICQVIVSMQPMVNPRVLFCLITKYLYPARSTDE